MICPPYPRRCALHHNPGSNETIWERPKHDHACPPPANPRIISYPPTLPIPTTSTILSPTELSGLLSQSTLMTAPYVLKTSKLLTLTLLRRASDFQKAILHRVFP